MLRYRFGDKWIQTPYHHRMNLREWGRHLRKLRKPRYSNAEDFATAVGVSKRTVENWESGVHWPEAPHMAQLVRVLGPEADPGAAMQLSRIEGKLDRILTILGDKGEPATEASVVEVESIIGDVPRAGDSRDESI